MFERTPFLTFGKSLLILQATDGYLNCQLILLSLKNHAQRFAYH